MAELVKSKTQLVCEIIVAILLAAFVTYAPGLVGTALIPSDSPLAPLIPVLVGIIYLAAYELLSVEGYQVFKEALEKLRTPPQDDRAEIGLPVIFVAFLLVAIVVLALIAVYVYHVDLAATLAGVFVVVVGVLSALKNKLFPKPGPEPGKPEPTLAETITVNGITFTKRPGDPKGVYFNEERKMVYVVWRGHDLRTVIASPPFSGYLVYTKNGEQRDCVYADGVLYSTRADPLEEQATKHEILEKIAGLSGRDAIKHVIGELEARGVDVNVAKLSILWPRTYTEDVARMRADGSWDAFVNGNIPISLPLLWDNYMKNMIPEAMHRDAEKLVNEYITDYVG